MKNGISLSLSLPINNNNNKIKERKKETRVASSRMNTLENPCQRG
jgi:hypothetical protein